jgi:ribosome-associated toxin RatA of RatAB toxin-antitoxin module
VPGEALAVTVVGDEFHRLESIWELEKESCKISWLLDIKCALQLLLEFGFSVKAVLNSRFFG